MGLSSQATADAIRILAEENIIAMVSDTTQSKALLS